MSEKIEWKYLTYPLLVFFVFLINQERIKLNISQISTKVEQNIKNIE